MNFKKKIIWLIPFLAMLLAIMPFAAVANASAQSDGWRVDDDGDIRYYRDGEFLVGNHEIGKYTYTFASDGGYIGLYDKHTNVGKVDISLDAEYEAALKTLADQGKVYSYHTFDKDEEFVKNNYSVSVPVSGSLEPYSSKSQKSNYIESLCKMYSKVQGIYSSNSKYVYAVQRDTLFDMVERGNGSALHVTSAKNVSVHSYIDVNFAGHNAGEDIVIEIDYKLGEGYNYNSSIFAVRDNNNPDQIALGGKETSYTPALLTLNPNGGVYIGSAKDYLIAVLNTEEYTRFSVAIHPATNSMDVYVNGALVADEVKFLTNKNYDAMNFQAEMLRGAQLTGVNIGSLYVDNFAAYQASEPVYTVNTEAKNGVYEEGSVLRYYRNNTIALGYMSVSGTFGDTVYNGEKINFGTVSGNGAYVPGYKAKVMINGKVASDNVISGDLFIAPDAAVMDSGTFGGWKVTDGSKTVLLSPGQLYLMEGDITCEAVEMEFCMLSGASVRTTDNASTALRFMSRLDKKNYDALISAGAKVEMHMLIAPDEYFDKTYGYYTVEALEKSGVTDYKDIKLVAPYSTNDNYYYFVGETADILPADYDKMYSAVSYMVITYPGGASTTVYTDFSEEDNSRCVYQVAHAAYNDRVISKIGEYSNKIKFSGMKTYSPYSSNRLSVIKSYADTVIVLEASGKIVKSAGDFYSAPYHVTSSFNEETGKNDISVKPKNGGNRIAEALCVVYNGKRLAENEYTVSDICTFSVDAISYSLSELITSDGHSKSWEMINPEMDISLFGDMVTDEQYIHEDQTSESSLLWSYAVSSSINIYPSETYMLGKRGNRGAYVSSTYANGVKYYDMSDWQALSFYVWSSKDAQSFFFQFVSDDPQTTDTDYYGLKIQLKNGWNHISVSKSEFGATRSPLGWHMITRINMTSTGWSQNNSSTTRLFLSEFTAYDTVEASNPLTDKKFSDAAVFANGGYCVGVDGEKIAIDDGDGSTTVFEKNGIQYLPMASVAAKKAEYGTYYPDEGVLKFKHEGKEYVFEQGTLNYTVDGKINKLTVAPVVSGRALFFAAEDVMSIFGYTQKYVDRMGLVVLSNTAALLDEDADYDIIYSAIEYMIYIRPSGEKIIGDLNEYSGGQHPYLMVDNEGFDALRFYAEMDVTMQNYIASLEKTYGIGTAKYNAEVNSYRLTDGVRLLSISRDVMNKTISWALLAKLYEVKDPDISKQYAERVWAEMEAVCNFKDEKGLYSWHPDHFLDVAEIAYPVAICYDWLYDYWTKTDNNVDQAKYKYEQTVTRRQLLEDAMYWMALSASNALPDDVTGKYIGGSYAIAGSTNNWNSVCNGGLMAAALAICNVERYAENVKTYVNAAITAVEKGMWVYAPEGGYEEGPGYWSYGTTYCSVFISCLDSACGSNYGLYNAPGFGRSVYFTTYLGSEATTWGFHDGGSGSADTNIASWFAKKDSDPNVNAIRRQAIQNGWKSVSMYDVMYFDPHNMTSTISLGLDSRYSLDSIMTFRSSWEAGNSIFAGLHGGDNTASHGDLDIGNFVINVNGSFIISDLGGDNYNVAGYFGVYRWSYYRKRAEGQNTLVMLPSAKNKNGNGWNGKTGKPCIVNQSTNASGTTNQPEADQVKNAVSEILRYETGTGSAIGVVDMAPAYEKMTSGVRGLWFTDDRSTIVIQDEAVFSEKMDIWWFAHTQGEITISDDGKSAVIYYNGVYLYAEIVTDNMTADVKFTEMGAVSLDKEYVGDPDSDPTGKFTSDKESDRSNIRKLCVAVDDVTELRLAVVFKVLESAGTEPALGTVYTWQNISEWKVD